MKIKIKKLEEDISNQKPAISGAIDQVGIEGLEMPIRIPHNTAKKTKKCLSLPAVISAMVSLDTPHKRGIHMSRIYLALHNCLEKTPLTLSTIKTLLKHLVKSQKGLSKKAYLKIKWQHPVKRKALKSEFLEGWRCYPVFYEGTLKEGGLMDLAMGFEVTYSSTCPCSARLARSLIQEKFNKSFASSSVSKQQVTEWLGKESSISATPHAQKSRAIITIKVTKERQSLLTLINEVELALGTPVQTAVKRVDEQEFAKLNSENLMFSEDSARRITSLLNKKPWISNYQVYVKHFESLHPFEVACKINK